MTEPKDKETPAGDKGNLPDSVVKVLEDIKAGMAPKDTPEPVSSGPSAQDIREETRKQLGFTEEQMRAHEGMIRRSQAPLVESAGWARLEKKTDIDSLKKDIEEELKIYPPENRTPDIMEKVYYMVRGKKADSQPAAAPKKKEEGGSSRVVYTRARPYTGSEEGVAGAGDSGVGEELTEQEKHIADRLGVPHDRYVAAHKAGRENAVQALRPKEDSNSGNAADMEMRRMKAAR